MADQQKPPGGKPPGPAGGRPPGRVIPKVTKVTLSKGKVKAGGAAMAAMKEEKNKAAPVLEKVEEKVLALENLPQISPPDLALFKDFVEKLGKLLSLPKLSSRIIKAFANIDVTAERVATTLQANQYYRYQFFRNIEAMGRRSELPSDEGAVILLGMQNSRNLLLALQLLRTMSGGHIEWTKEGKLKVAANEMLKYALKTEEILAGNKTDYADTAYAAGILFDVMTLYTQYFVEDKKPMLAYIDVMYTHGLQTAKIGVELSKNLSDFSFPKYAFSAGLIHDIGKVMLAALNPGYMGFMEEVSKRGLPRPVRTFAEFKQFGMTHAMLGGMACQYYKIFQAISPAVFHHHDPYLLRGANKSMYQLCSLVCLATNMAGNLKKVDKADDPLLQLWKGPELRDFRVDPRVMMKAAAAVT